MIIIIILGFYFLWGLMDNIFYKVFLIPFVPLVSAIVVERILSRYVNAVVSFFLKDKWK